MVEASHIETDTRVSLAPSTTWPSSSCSPCSSRVRDYLIELVAPHAESITDPILREAAEVAIQGVQDGSFYHRVLEPLKKQDRVSGSLITQVDQVRDYRNWVAHGRRDAPTNNVTPKAAYDRLSEFSGLE